MAGAILLPGAVLPAELAYGALVEALGDEIAVRAKDLEVYATDEPPENYGLGVEIDGVIREAEAAGFERFHLVGYSAGGAIAAAFAARHPDRLLSLALLEPAWIGNQGMSEAERRAGRELDQAAQLPAEEMMPRFVRLQLAPGTDPPPPPPEPPGPWMAKRPAGIRALLDEFKSYELDPEELAAFTMPAYYALGSLSNPDVYGEMANRASRTFADFELDVFEGRHHFDPPHRVEPERLATRLRELWSRATAIA